MTQRPTKAQICPAASFVGKMSNDTAELATEIAVWRAILRWMTAPSTGLRLHKENQNRKERALVKVRHNDSRATETNPMLPASPMRRLARLRLHPSSTYPTHPRPISPSSVHLLAGVVRLRRRRLPTNDWLKKRSVTRRLSKPTANAYANSAITVDDGATRARLVGDGPPRYVFARGAEPPDSCRAADVRDAETKEWRRQIGSRRRACTTSAVWFDRSERSYSAVWTGSARRTRLESSQSVINHSSTTMTYVRTYVRTRDVHRGACVR